MSSQCTNKILMVKPSKFHFNEETALNNYYQKNDNNSLNLIQEKALLEFNHLVEAIKKVGVTVITPEDTPTPNTPDSIFPNNWFISEPDGKLFLCPMFAENRRLERIKFLGTLIDNINCKNIKLLNFTKFEKENLFLEGTGALVLDRVNKIAYGSLSKRCDKELFEAFTRETGYKMIAFHSYQSINSQRLPIYHTNVMMALCSNFAILCKDSIDNLEEREIVINSLIESGKKIIYITEDQTNNFAGNVIQIKNNKGDLFTLMSERAYRAFSAEDIKIIEENSTIIFSPIPTIENYGGGSVRCMISEIF